MDEYYVPNRNAYHKYHFIHGNIVHAFDDEKRTISMLGYKGVTDTYAHYENIERHNVKEGRIYGLKIYDEILNKEDLCQKFMRDRRCSYIMGEHKRIMIRRISYFHDTGILTDEEYAIHNSHYTDIAKMAEIMCLSVVKNRIKGREDARNKIYDMLMKLKEKETIAIDLLIRDLEKRI